MAGSLGERLKEALERKDMSVREFHRTLEEKYPELRGISYPQVHRYLSDKSEPSLEFVRSAAKLLDVRPSWLALEDGPPTQQEQMNERLLEGAKSIMLRDLSEGFGTEIPRGLPAAIAFNFWMTAYEAPGIKLDTFEEDDGSVSESLDQHRLARLFGRGLAASLRGFGIDPNDLKRQELETYLGLVCHAITPLIDRIHIPKEGHLG